MKPETGSYWIVAKPDLSAHPDFTAISRKRRKEFATKSVSAKERLLVLTGGDEAKVRFSLMSSPGPRFATYDNFLANCVPESRTRL
jgi:hypothetical protein